MRLQVCAVAWIGTFRLLGMGIRGPPYLWHKFNKIAQEFVTKECVVICTRNCVSMVFQLCVKNFLCSMSSLLSAAPFRKQVARQCSGAFRRDSAETVWCCPSDLY